jgi:hypothetical protein
MKGIDMNEFQKNQRQEYNQDEQTQIEMVMEISLKRGCKAEDVADLLIKEEKKRMDNDCAVFKEAIRMSILAGRNATFRFMSSRRECLRSWPKPYVEFISKKLKNAGEIKTIDGRNGGTIYFF